ncbi:phage portal protein [Listeria booriae]|uniref:phage portal protein n=1 Tax=Listeria booriae TaxID=1552123 RepID=UPI0016261A3E|nr:phage portal protein [Listeria booriae]MBC2106141.1 phage portal protein [Listeria booriae]
MGLFDIFGKGKVAVKEANLERVIEMMCYDTQVNVAFKNYAIQICINKIANALTKCDFQTFVKGQKKDGDMYYKLNYEPNKNENASVFWNKVIRQMVFNPDGALIIQTDTGEFLVADAFTLDTYAVKENIYRLVEVEGYQFERIFPESKVLHLRLNNSNVKQVLDGIYSDYGKLIAGSIKNYNRSNAIKYIANLDTMVDQWKNEKYIDEKGNERNRFDDTMDDLFDNRFKNFLSDKDSVMPLEKGIELSDMNASGNSKSSGSAANKTTRDITAIFDDVVNMCADAFQIPRGLLKGDTADIEAMTDNFIAFCINPIVEQLRDEVNRKLYGKTNVLQKTYMKIKTTNIRSYDISKLATPAELMARIRVYSVNDIRNLIDEERIDEPWADEYIGSKNYELSGNEKGGVEKDDKKNE